ncbi:MAG TPA: hypothetical protein VMG31_10115 [Verrucomicrobiae bacterium]|nr:hypothetical protein [Verrucomicrobiae bacterium]
MSIQEITPEEFAERFHHYHQVLAPQAPRENERNGEAWNSLPVRERDRLIAAARLALLELASAAHEHRGSPRYFAKPGEAEWGC